MSTCTVTRGYDTHLDILSETPGPEHHWYSIAKIHSGFIVLPGQCREAGLGIYNKNMKISLLAANCVVGEVTCTTKRDTS